MFDILWYRLKSVINIITWADIVDILIVALLLYIAIKWARETRAYQLIKGILALLIVYLISAQIGLRTLTFIMENVIQIGAFAIIVVFQPELRRMLEHVGRTKITNLSVFSSNRDDNEQLQMKKMKAIDSVVSACDYLSKRKIGALIVFERKTKLGEIIKTGTVIDSEPSRELLGNIFFPNSPLHDGALIIREGKLYAAGCFLPLSENYQISKDLGTRHRAALGISENSDAVVVVVSEETGLITIANDGKIERGYSLERLSETLKSFLIEENVAKSESKRPKIRSKIWKVKQ